ncbi:MAG: NADH-quinone oxidoreductase subunit N [Chloroflexi bacterium]|nr:NADH-quinone oxidoreductase subunit N [Chloroflexota bacterium]
MGEFDLLSSLPAIAPEIGLTILIFVAVLLDSFLHESQRKGIAYVAALGMAALAIVPIIPGWAPEPGPTGDYLFWGGMIRHDALAQIFRIMVLASGALTCLMAVDAKRVGNKGEFYTIVLVATLGASLLSASADLIMVFVALETLSIALYCLAAFKRNDSKSTESGMKYFLFGAFSSAIMLYGFSLLYGFTGQTNLYALAQFMGTEAFANNAVPVLAAMVMVIVGFGFKISAVPFHFWTPDVYEGAPTPVTAFLSVASKAASFAVMMRFFIAVFPNDLVIGDYVIQNFWVQFMAAAAVISMTLGNVIALSQKNIKRLLAYSSIAQAGYVLMGVAALQATTPLGAERAVASVGFYLFMYTFSNLLAFAVIILFSEATGSETIADLAGLNRRSPWLALTLTIALLSLAGVPPAAGFFGKFYLFTAAVEADLVWLAMIGVLNAIVGLYYYLVVIKVMYVDRSEDEDKPIPTSQTYRWVLGVATLAVIILGTVGAQVIFEWAVQGAGTLFALLPGVF